jgi:hypothetical protein
MDVTKLLFSVDGFPSLLHSIGSVTAGILLLLTSFMVIYNLYFHPLASYPGPWYAKTSSLPLAIISWWKFEPQWLLGVVRSYGCESPYNHSRLAPHFGTCP